MYGAFVVLVVLFNLAWLISVIHLGFRDRTWGFPAGAVLFNISWDATAAFGGYDQLVLAQGVPQWLLISPFVIGDLICVWQIVVYGPSQFPQVSKRTFYLVFGLMAATMLWAVPVFNQGFSDESHGTYSHFMTLLAVSVLLPVMLYNRRSLAGQSVAAATLWLGFVVTIAALVLVAPSLPFPMDAHRELAIYLCLASVVASTVYFIAVLRMKQRQGSENRQLEVATPRPVG
ncbi:hypothetical protein [Saccharopolyspora phatthalungensis]|uniref:Uncharacterized protein n=1 Tax=Saccharopolyspora phatthalungensis TaxID=664693 RepID=A0A840QG08_9PSEU|nr:hypothetical protein [Saccharopolyspora phatthalungensis]MBB5158880.1 hypothetical protein [Saccharopolyspora phatthalungensis]